MIGHLENIQLGPNQYGGSSQSGCSLNHQEIMRNWPSHWDFWYLYCHSWLFILQVPSRISCLETRKYRI